MQFFTGMRQIEVHLFQDIAFTCSPDATVRVWSVQNGNCSTVIRTHKEAVTGEHVTPIGGLLF